MAAQLVVVQNKSPEELADEFIAHAPDEVIVCRGQRHSWPKLRPGKIAGGIKATPAPQGCFQVTFTCEVCGTKRTLTTLPRGVFDTNSHYKYEYVDGYLPTKGTARMNPREFMAEAFDRAIEDLLAQTLPPETVVKKTRRRKASVVGSSA